MTNHVDNRFIKGLFSGLLVAASAGIATYYFMRDTTVSSVVCTPDKRCRKKTKETVRGTVEPRVAVVTGGSRGIGAAICELLAREGYHVVVNYVSNEKKANVVVKRCQERGANAVAIRANVSKEADVASLFRKASQWAREHNLGEIEAVVNNAAIIGEKRNLETSSSDNLRALFATNVFGAFYVMRDAIEYMSTKRGRCGGSIVNISSGSAFIGQPLTYAMTKGALNSLTIGSVAELATHGIRVNAISPGLTKTDMVSSETIRSCISSIPMGRAGEPVEIAEGVAWLLSENASYVAGANVRIAGGRRMGSGCQ